MDVLLAGCGWLGREVARRLVARGDRVTALTLTVASATALSESGIEALALDLAAPGASRSIPGRFDGVVAMQSARGSDAAAYRRAYLDATRALLESDGADGAAFVYVGSTGVFGQSDGSWVDESTQPAPSEPTAEVLVAAERLVLDGSWQGSAPRIVRCSGLYGPGRTGTIERVRTGSLALGEGDETWMNFCHRDDAAVAVVTALDRGAPGAIYHASDAFPAMRRDVVRFIAGRLGIDPPVTSAGSARLGRRGVNRRVDSEATRRELATVLAYPSFREGFAGLLGDRG
jgi:nucleoside-diphosphate-sugar epimerase